MRDIRTLQCVIHKQAAGVGEFRWEQKSGGALPAPPCRMSGKPFVAATVQQLSSGLWLCHDVKPPLPQLVLHSITHDHSFG